MFYNVFVVNSGEYRTANLKLNLEKKFELYSLASNIEKLQSNTEGSKFVTYLNEYEEQSSAQGDIRCI